MNYFNCKQPLPESPSTSNSSTTSSGDTIHKRKRCSASEEVESKTDSEGCAGQVKSKAAVDELGRVRKFPHVEGNFATVVFIPDWLPELIDVLAAKIRQKLCIDIHSLLPIKHGSKATEEVDGVGLHISLSKSFAITMDERDTLLTLLQKKLRRHQSCRALEFEHMECFVNDDRSRTFVALRAICGEDFLLSLIKDIDTVLLLHKKPTFYENPIVHVSVAWVANDQQNALQTLLNNESNTRSWTQQMTSIVCRVGSKNHVIWPSAK